MQKKYACLILTLTLISTWQIAFSQGYTPADSLSLTRLKQHIKTLSADSLQGRPTGSAGCRKAAYYIADQMQKAGLQPLNSNPSAANPYFLPYQLERITWHNASIRIKGHDLYPGLGFVSIGGFVAHCGQINEVVFAGFGLDTEQYTDYLSADALNRGVVVFPGTPTLANGNSFLGDSGQILDRNFAHRKQAAQAHGAKAMFYALFETNQALQQWAQSIHYTQPSSFIRLPGSHNGFPVFIISQTTAAQMLRTKLSQLKKIYAPYSKPSTNKKKKAISVPISGYRLDGRTTVDTMQTQNVAGLLPANQPSSEYVVLSAHYDHLGIDSTTREVYNGADDNASGTAAVIEVGHRLKHHKRNRNIIFLTVSGEEIGLFGSKSFCANPPVDLKNIVANVNIDMVGRHDTLIGQGSYLYSIGSKALPARLDSLAQAVAQPLQLSYDLDGPNHPLRLMYRSDHYSFVQKGIPAVFLFGGFHAHYHTTHDTEDKINYPLMLGRVHFAERLTHKLSLEPQRIDYGLPRLERKEGF